MEKKLPLPSCPVAMILCHGDEINKAIPSMYWQWLQDGCFRVKTTYENGIPQHEYIKSEPKMTITVRDKKESDAG